MKIGVGGGYGAGKNLVAKVFERLGGVVVDCDRIAREVVAPGTDGLAAVVERFGGKMRMPDGELDRGRLGEIVFADPMARRDLEGILHPLIRARTLEEAGRAEAAGRVAVVMAPLLFETGLYQLMDRSVLVEAPVEERIRRGSVRDRITPEEARQRIEAQWPPEKSRPLADRGVVNDGTPEEGERRAKEVWGELTADQM